MSMDGNSMKHWVLTRLLATMMCSLPAGAWAQGPLTMTYQGTLSDAGGQVVEGDRTIAFRLYSDAEGGEPVWFESHVAVEVVDGVFSVVLGLSSALDAGLTDAESLYLGVQVADDDEMAPRMRVGGALKAQWAAVAEHARDVRDEHIHPSAVSIGDGPVIDAQGRWVGDPTGLRGPAGPGIEMNADTDMDGVFDWLEIMVGSDPVDGADQPADANEDGVPDVIQLVGPAGDVGPAGVGVASAAIDDEGRLIVTYSDGREEDTGTAVGATGPQGDPGIAGDQGGDGASVTQASVNAAGNLILTLSTGATIDAGRVLGDQGPVGGGGPQGDPGVQGAPGPQGDPGTSIIQVAVDEAGDLILGLSTGESLNAGNVIGPEGPAGLDAAPGDVAAALGQDAAFRSRVAQNIVEDHPDALDEALQGAAGGREGSGTISRYTNQFSLGAYSKSKEYIHLLNPTAPKMLMYLYGEDPSSSAGRDTLNIIGNTNLSSYYNHTLRGAAGDSQVTVGSSEGLNPGIQIMLHQLRGPNAGQWELNTVVNVAANTITLGKPLENTYETGGDSQAQIVRAYSAEVLDVTGRLYTSNGVAADNVGGVLYVRAREVFVRGGGSIDADHVGYGVAGGNTQRSGYSYCSPNVVPSPAANCSGGGAGTHSAGGCNSNNGSGAGGSNRTAGTQSNHRSGTPGLVWGEEEGGLLKPGGGGGAGGGWCHGNFELGSAGGGVVVIGAQRIVVEAGGRISANAADGHRQSWGNHSAQGGGGAGGMVRLYASNILNEGTIEATGGLGAQNAWNNRTGGTGGEGWIVEEQPIAGIVNQTVPTEVEIWIDGQNVTAQVGNPNGKPAPDWNAETQRWGMIGESPTWSTGPLDISGATDWTLGEHTVELREKGGTGGDIKSYIYSIQTFSASLPPDNNACGGAQVLDIDAEPVTVSGTTEDLMGKNLATDDHNAADCVAAGGSDVVYRIDLAERSLIGASIQAPFAAKMVLRAADCAEGELVYCADGDFTSNPLERGTYYLWVDSDDARAKGNFNLTVTRTPAVLPANDTCETAQELEFAGQPQAAAIGTSIYALDQYYAPWCPDAGDAGGPDVVYTFLAPAGAPLNITMEAEFDGVMILSRGGCNPVENAVDCGTAQISLNAQVGGRYYLFIDGNAEQEWGEYNVQISFE